MELFSLSIRFANSAFRLLPAGSAIRQLREHAALSTDASNRATYEGYGCVVERHSHRYQVTETGISLCYQRRRVLSPALGAVFDEQTGPLALRPRDLTPPGRTFRRRLARMERNRFFQGVQIP